MDNTKHFIEFADYVFAIEDVHCIRKYYSLYGEKNDKWKSCIYLNPYERMIIFPIEQYEVIKDILLNFKNKEVN